jgi:hypothetical protein
MADHKKAKEMLIMQFLLFSQTVYDANFKLMPIRYTEEINNCREQRKYSIIVNQWCYKKGNKSSSIRKTFYGPKMDYCNHMGET